MMHTDNGPAALCVMTPAENSQWRPVNDVVMGGRSSSQFSIQASPADDETAYVGVFTGFVTNENNGGFASVARPISPEDAQQWLNYTGIALRCRGDGKVYQLRLRTTHQGVSTRYKFEFGPVSPEWQVITAPFSQFIATFRGKELPNAPPIDNQSIDEVGLLISKQQLGDFCLQVQGFYLLDSSSVLSC